MKNILKTSKTLLMSFFAILTVFALGASSADAAPSSISVQRAQVLKDYVSNHEYGFTVFTTTDGKTIYCVDPDKKALLSGQTASFSKDGDAGLLYLLQNGYPNKSITGTSEAAQDADKYITQAAIWWYMDETGQAGKFSDGFKNATQETDIYKFVPTYIKPMVQAAKSAKDTQVQPSMDVSATTTTFVLTSDGKYYETPLLTAKLAGSNTYNVEVTGGTANTVVMDEQGNLGSTMNNNEKFKIRVPVAEVSKSLNINIKFTSSGTVKKAKIYKPADNNYQRVVGLYDETISLTKTVNASITKRVCEYTGGKYYDKDGKETTKENYDKQCNNSCKFIDNKYYGKDGKETTKENYDKECKHICEVDNGKYYDKDGKETTKETYEKQCKHVCEFTDNKYYGKDGKEVTKTQYDKECNSTCAIIDNKYYGKDGKEVTKQVFNKECKNICKVDNNKYYGINGNVVDKDTFDRQCGQEVVVPNTSANIVFWSIGLGILAIALGAGIIIYRNKKHVTKA